MIIIPAIDLLDGKAVRLYKGDYTQKTFYSDQPEKLALDFENMGANWLHIVDLNGAKEGVVRNSEVIRKIKSQTTLNIEVGGGIRTLETIEFYLTELNVSRVILGTVALEKPEILELALVRFGAKRIAVGVDVKDDFISTNGWLTRSKKPYLEFMKDLEQLGVEYAVVTDISKDGTLTGPNFKLYQEIKTYSNINIVVSGGVRDTESLTQAEKAGYYAIIIGKAYYEGKIDLKEVLHDLN